MNIIGISAFFHDSSCCLLQDGLLVAAASEERFSRIKHDARLPVSAFRFCLDQGKISINDIDIIAYYENPFTKADRQQWALGQVQSGHIQLPDPDFPENEIRDKLGFDGEILFFDHHSSHAASAFFYSGFEESAIYTADSVGEWTTTTFGRGVGSQIKRVDEILFPHSIGLLYSTITAFLGFGVNNGEYRVMGLAPYGKPLYLKKLWNLIQLKDQGGFELDLQYFDFIAGSTMYSEKLADLVGFLPRKPESEITKIHFDLAASIQCLLEEVLLFQIDFLHQKVPSENLCMAGGVALNCVANSKILNTGKFKNLFIQPAAGDAGGCVGAATLAHIQITKTWSIKRQKHINLGSSFNQNQIKLILQGIGIKYLFFNDEQELLNIISIQFLSENKIIGWFQGPMEFGPRALGSRSILANPRDPEMRDRINKMVKKREAFRPFAPSVLEEHASDHFKLDHPSPFMLETCQVISPLQLPAITHVDGSARPQTVGGYANPKFRKLLETYYELTGCPILLNTSFNVRGEPIVCTPVDGLICMIEANLDALVIGDFLIEKSSISETQRALLYTLKPKRKTGNLKDNLYTFV
ncbi:MAG: carbamoyltransferase [Bacteroidota bacterium]